MVGLLGLRFHRLLKVLLKVRGVLFLAGLVGLHLTLALLLVADAGDFHESVVHGAQPACFLAQDARLF